MGVIIEIGDKSFERREMVTNAGLEHFREPYQNQSIDKEDVFFYIYGLLHSEDYKKRYADNLAKELPRIPRMKYFEDFLRFRTAGAELAHLHVHYEEVPMFDEEKINQWLTITKLTDEDFRVAKMRFGKHEDKTVDKTTIIYNHKITMTGIPIEAYDYVVNSKPALEWVMERQAVTTHKDSGIVNDANDWAIETMGNARYPFELFLRMVTVSLETMKIVRALPKLDIYKR